jgi:hypothetical protein
MHTPIPSLIIIFDVQPAGTCMMRTRDLTDPTAWRAWNGSAFSVSLSVSPYAHPNLDPSQHVCTPFSEITLVYTGGPTPLHVAVPVLLPLRSYVTLLWSTLFNRYMAFSTAGGNDGAGWAFQLSDDLEAWDAPINVETNGLVIPAGNGSAIGPATQADMPGRFIQRNGSSAIFWEDPGHETRHSVGSCRCGRRSGHAWLPQRVNSELGFCPMFVRHHQSC